MRVIGIGKQDFADIRSTGTFYVDKTDFIRQWWDNQDSVTLIARPRRFGKTLTISMVEEFFSVRYAGRSELFEGLSIWKEERFRKLQGTYPVISLSFANVKEQKFHQAKERICQLLAGLYNQNAFLLDSGILTEEERSYFLSVTSSMSEVTATIAVYKLSEFLARYYGKKVIILLDEYDTPMQEAYTDGYWTEITSFIRSFFNASFKTNPWLERALMTGITRVSKESIFSDLNNLEVVTTTSFKYEDAFGFTEKEVFEVLEEYGIFDTKEDVKRWYDGFTFGHKRDIYNPWSIINYLDKKRLAPYWANTSSNSLAGRLIQKGSKTIKQDFETLLNGGTLRAVIDEQIVYSQLEQEENAVWSLLLASGYLKVKQITYPESDGQTWLPEYELELTNLEVKIMFQSMIRQWFGNTRSDYNDFIQALLLDDVDAMNEYMNRVAFKTFSFFDTGNHPSRNTEPERFYHGFVLGLMVELADRYHITSNRESGFGRYDIMLEPRNKELDAIILEFKVRNPRREKCLEETVHAALTQIEKKNYEQVLKEQGIPSSRIRRYGFAFEGKTVLIG